MGIKILFAISLMLIHNTPGYTEPTTFRSPPDPVKKARLQVGSGIVSLSGKIICETFPGPPNYESIADGDRPETCLMLVPTEPLLVKDDFGGETLVAKVQLVLFHSGLPDCTNISKYRASLEGRLFPAETGHHRSEVLLEVTKIRIEK